MRYDTNKKMGDLPRFNKSGVSLKEQTKCNGMLLNKCQKYSYACLLVFWWWSWYIDISVHIKQTKLMTMQISKYILGLND